MKGWVRQWMWLSLLILASTARAAAVTPVIVGQSEQFKSLPLRPYILHYAGSSHFQSVQQAATTSNSEYAVLTKASPLLPLSEQWFRFFIRNNSNAKRSFVFNLDQTLFSKIDLQAAANGVVVKRVLTGQDYPYSSRDLKYDYYAFQLDVPAGETLQVDFSLATKFSALFIPELIDEEWFLHRATASGRFTGAITGIIYSVILFMPIYMLRMRRMGVEFQMWLFAVANFMSVLYIAGVVQRIIPDAYLEWRNISFLVIHGLQGFLFTQVLRSCYRTSVKYPALDRVLWIVGALLLVGILLLPVVPDASLYITIMALNTVSLLLAVVIALFTLYKSWSEYWFFSGGLILFVLLMFSSSLPAFALLPNSLLTRHGYEVGLTLQVTFLFIIIASKIFTEEKEKLAIQEQMLKVNSDMQARSEFVDRVTHDVKSPLSAVVGAVHLLRESVTPEQKTKYLDVIQQSSNTVIAIVDSILSYSRIKSGHVALHKQSFSIAALLSELENAMHVSHRQKNIAFSVVSDGMLPLLVVGDRNRLQQLLNNLLTNAFKFTDEGSVKLLVSVVARSVESVTLRFEVHDTGIGMSPAFVTRAFEPYAREESTAGYRQGFGLGLPICKQLVEMMHGTIHISSSLGVGSVFIVELPFDLPA
ncbi:MAG: ATP-binding protein [Pseudomonadales bacterium]